MAKYDYICEPCKLVVEITKPMDESHREEQCEHCGLALSRVVNAPAFHLKGSGWYKTDYTNRGGAYQDKGPKGKGTK